MRPYLLRPLLVLVFLIALNAWQGFWALVGGQSHLDLMLWPWKLILSLAVAGLATALTAELASRTAPRARTLWTLTTLLAATMAIAGAVTYYYHLNEPTEEESGDEPSITKTMDFRRRSPVLRSAAADSAAPVPR